LCLSLSKRGRLLEQRVFLKVISWVLIITRYEKSSIGFAKQFVQVYRIHNQSSIHKDSDWTSSRAKEFYLKLRSVWKNASEEMCLKKCIWRNGSEEELLKTRHQKQGSSEAPRQKLLHQSWQRTLYEVYDHELCNHHLCNFVSTSRQDNSNIAVDVVPFVMEWIWN